MQGVVKKIISKVSDETKGKWISSYVKHLHLYDQGEALVCSLRIISVQHIVIGMAGLKIIWPDIDPKIVLIAGIFYYPVRTMFHWCVGYFWEVSDGYKVKAAWSKDRDTPTRVIIVNPEDFGDTFEKPGE